MVIVLGLNASVCFAAAAFYALGVAQGLAVAGSILTIWTCIIANLPDKVFRCEPPGKKRPRYAAGSLGTWI